MRVLEVKCNTDEESEVAGKWKGYVTASIAVTLDRAWQIGSDFSGLHKFVPIVEVCERLKGCNRSPGCLRFYTMNSATGLPGGKRKAWAKDRLLTLNDENHSFAYAVEGSNMNLEKCEVSFKASDGKDGTTIIKWAWELDPVKKSTKEKTLGEMSEFGCTFIKGLEAAAATTDSIDMDFEGALLDTLISGDGDGGGFHSPPPDPPNPFLSLMKSRLDTLTESLAKITQNLNEGPIPADLYETELESLQSILDEGRRSLLTYLHGYMSDKSTDQGKSIENSNQSAERYEHYCISSSETISSRADASTSKTNSEASWGKPLDALTAGNSIKSGKSYEEYYISSSETMSPRAEASTSKTNSEVYCRKLGGVLTPRVKCPPDKGKARTPDRECQAGLPESPKLPSAEELRLIMEAASRGALDAFYDFSSQFHSDLRDDISHQLESVEAQLESVNFQMQEARRPKVKDETFKNYPTAERDGENSRLGTPRPFEEGQESAETPLLETYPDAKWPPSPPSPLSPVSPSPPSHEAKMSPPRSQTPEGKRGEFGIWKLDRLRSQRSQGSPQGIHSVRSKSMLLFQDLLQDEMRPDSDRESSPETKISPRTFQSTESFQKSSVSDGYGSGHQTYTSRGQRSPSPHSPKVTNVPLELHSQPQGSESGRLRTSPPWQNDNPRIGLNPDDSSDDSFQKFGSGGSSEGVQQLQDSIKAWKQRGPKMGQTAHNLEADLKSSQISEKKLQVGGPSESTDGYFHGYNVSHRPSRLPPDIWPNFPQGESGSRRNVPNSVEVQDDSRGTCSGHDLVFEFRKEEVVVTPNFQRPRDVVPAQRHSPISPSPCQSSTTYKKILKHKSLSRPCSPSQRELVGGSRHHVNSPSKSLDEMSSKLGSEGANISPISGSPSCSLDQASGSPLSAGYSLGQCSNRNVMLDLKHEIAPGVFHCRQENQTRVVINIPEDVEALNDSRRQLRSLLRKDEIYKEFKLLGIQKPPTEEQILEDFAAARYKKHQEAISETKTLRKDFPVYQPYNADGKVWAPHAGPCPIVDRHRFEKVDAQSVDTSSLTLAGHLSETKSQSGQSAGHSSETSVLSSSKVRQGRSSFDRIIGTRSQSEQQLSVMNSCEGDESPTISDGLRGATTARELTAYDLATLTSWGGLKGHPGSRPSRAQTAERSTSRHGFPIQKREILNIEHGRTSHVQPSSSPKRKAKPKSGASGLIKPSPHSLVTSSRDNTSREHTSMDSGDSFPQEERLDEIVSGFSITPLNFKKVQANLLKTSSSSVATRPNESRPLEAVSPRSSLDNSIDNVLSDLPQFSEEIQWLDIILKKPTSREHSLDEFMHNIPSDSGSSDFDPYRSSGNLGSIAGSTGSNTGSVHSFKDRLFPDNSSQLTPSEETTSPPDALSYSITDVFDTAKTKQPDFIHSPLMYPDDFVEAERISNSMISSCQNCPFGQLKEEVDEIIHSSESGSPRFPHRLNVRVSWADESSVSPQRTCKSEELVGTPPPRTTRTLSAILDGMSQELKDIKAQQSNLNVRLEEAGPQTSKALDSQAQQSNLNVRLEEARPRKIKALDSKEEDLNVRSEESGRRRSKSVSTIKEKRQLNEKPRNSLNDVKFQRRIDWETEKRQMDETLRKINDTKRQRSLKSEKEKREKNERPRNSLSDTKLRKSIPDAKLRKIYHDAVTQTDFPEQPEVTQLSWSLQTSQNPRLLGVDGLSIRESTKILGSNENDADFTDDQKYSQMLNDMVGQRGDRESTNSFKARKKRAAEDLAFRTRQSAQMLNSMINVREFADDSRSYSVWLDGAAQTPEGNGRMSSETQTPKIVELSENGEPLDPLFNEGSETKTPGNVSESSESGEPGEALEPREPRFREDSAANFLGSMKMQILQEFSDPKKIEADGQDQIKGPREPRFREDSATNFLSALSQQIVQQFTEHMSRQGQGPGEYEAPREPRFREQSALDFLSDLSEQLHPEFQGRRTSQTTSERSNSREPRFRENSAINFLSALKGQVIQRSRQNSISEGASSSGQIFQLKTSQIMPPRYSEIIKQSEDQAYLADGSSYQPNPESEVNLIESVDFQTPIETEAYPNEDVSYQRDPMNQAYLTEGLNDQLVAQDQAFLSEGSGSQTGGEGQEYQLEGLNYQPESNDQGYGAKALNDQPDEDGQAYRIEDPIYQPDAITNQESQNHSFVGSGSRRSSQSQLLATGIRNSLRGSQNTILDADQDFQNQAFIRSGSRQYSQSRNSQSQLVAAEAQNSRRSSQNAVPDAENETFPGESPGSQPDAESQDYPIEGSSYQLESGGQAYGDEALNNLPDVEGQAYPTEDSVYQPDALTNQESQNQSFVRSWSRRNSQSQLVGARSGNSRRSSQISLPDASQESRNQAFVRSGSRQYSQSRKSQSQLVGAETQSARRSSQNAIPDIEGQAFPGEDFGSQLDEEGQAFPGVGFGSQADAEGQAFPGEGFGSQLDAESQAFPGEGFGSQPDAEDQAFPGEGFGLQPNAEDQEFPGEGFGFQPDAEDQAFPGEGFGSQPDAEDQAFPGEGFGLQPNAEDQEFPGEGFGFQPDAEDQAFPGEGFGSQPDAENQEYPVEGSSDQQPDAEGQGYTDEGLSFQPDLEGQDFSDEDLNFQSEDNPSGTESVNNQASEAGEGNSPADGMLDTMTDQESQNQSFVRSASRQYSQSRNYQSQPVAPGSRNSRTSSQNAVFDEMLQDMQTTISRSHQNSSSNQG